jgi:hypothetical protein
VRALIALAAVALVAGCFDTEPQPPTRTGTLDWRGPFTFGIGNVERMGGEPRFPEAPEDLERLDAFMAPFQEERMTACGATAPHAGGYVPGPDRGYGIINALVTCTREGWKSYDLQSTNRTYLIETFERVLTDADLQAYRAVTALNRLNSTGNPMEAELQAILLYKTVQYVESTERMEQASRQSIREGRAPSSMESLIMHATFHAGVVDLVRQFPWQGTPCPPDFSLQEQVRQRLDTAIRESHRLGPNISPKQAGIYSRFGEINDYAQRLYNASVANDWRSGLLMLDSLLSLNLAYWESFDSDRIPTYDEAATLLANKKAERWSLVERVLMDKDAAGVEDSNAAQWSRLTAGGRPSAVYEVARTIMVAHKMEWPFEHPCGVR